MIITLPFPPSDFSGHNNGYWRDLNKLIATYRAEAFHLTRTAQRGCGYIPQADGDIAIAFRFVPPDNRSDRTNFAGRLKAQIDGIAEALGVNDKRFLPSYEFSAPGKPGYVEVTL